MGFLALEEIFYTLSIRKVYGEVLDSNTPSIRMHQKLGFSQEGRFLCEHILKGDTYVDVIRFAQDAKRWKEFKNKFWYNWGQ